MHAKPKFYKWWIHKDFLTAFNVGKAAIAGASGTALGALCYYGFATSGADSAIEHSQYVWLYLLTYGCWYWICIAWFMSISQGIVKFFFNPRRPCIFLVPSSGILTITNMTM